MSFRNDGQLPCEIAHSLAARVRILRRAPDSSPIRKLTLIVGEMISNSAGMGYYHLQLPSPFPSKYNRELRK